ncbi:MAG: hypothetical protein Q9166_005758 [cf. Caloplaca sp. 2 TL-2023]
MVATRSYDRGNTLTTKESKGSPDSDVTPGKRKRLNVPTTSRTLKPRRQCPKLEGTSRSSENETSSTLAAVVIPVAVHKDASSQGDNVEEYKLGDDGTVEPRELRPEEGQLRPSIDDQEVVAVDKNTTSPRPVSGMTPPGTEQSTPSTKPTPSDRGKTTKPDKRDPPVEVASLVDAPYQDTPTQSVNMPAHSRYRRSGSGEADSNTLPSYANPPSSGILDAQRAIRETESVSSEDEAPEVVTKAAGQQNARSAAAEATKAAEAQRAVAKQKRRDRDRLLKSQAQVPKKVEERDDLKDDRLGMSTDDDEIHHKSLPQLDISDQRKISSKDLLPALLPDDVLAAEPMVRMPTPSSQHDITKAMVNTKRRFFEQTSKPPKDIQRGNFKIRVLDDRKSVLPPKVSKNSQIIRESWLAGRLGSKGMVVMQRRKMGTGFVRR